MVMEGIWKEDNAWTNIRRLLGLWTYHVTPTLGQSPLVMSSTTKFMFSLILARSSW